MNETLSQPGQLGPFKLTDKNKMRKPVNIAVLFASVVFVSHANINIQGADDTTVSPTDVQSGPRSLSRAFRIASQKATPSVVTVFSYGQNILPQEETPSDEDQPGPTPSPQSDDSGSIMQLTGLGSGVIVSPDGLVITNNHVIAGAKRVVVQLSDETEIEATEVHGDADSDIATLRIQRDEPFAASEMGDSDSLEIGDWVLAIGSPFKLEATVSAGIISAKNRTLQRIRRGRLLQTDAAINPGNSGGPLIDLDGRIIAINTAIATRNGSYQGIGFAIPINQVKWVAEELSEHGKVRRAMIGVVMAELTPKHAKLFNHPVGFGVLAYQVIAGSAADGAGIKPLDVILEFAGERVRKPASLQEIVERKPVGSTQSVKVFRAGEEIMVDVHLAPLEETVEAIQPADNKASEPDAIDSDKSDEDDSLNDDESKSKE